MLLSKFGNLFNFKSATCCFLLDQTSTRGQYSATNDGDARQHTHKHFVHSNTATRDLNLKPNLKKNTVPLPITFYFKPLTVNDWVFQL